MLKVGLTGGIGSGKTTVAKIFEVLGVPVFYADNASKELMNQNEEVKTAIIEAFGEKAYKADTADRKYLASQVFNDRQKLSALNAIIHPATIQMAKDWMESQSAPYAIKEAAIIFETGSQKDLDFVIGVTAPLELRVRRVMERDHVSRDEVLLRLSKQMDEDEKMKLCDFVILNDEEHPLIPQVLKVHSRLMQISRKE